MHLAPLFDYLTNSEKHKTRLPFDHVKQMAHTLRTGGIRVAPSPLGGHGLFAKIVFRPGDPICTYDGIYVTCGTFDAERDSHVARIPSSFNGLDGKDIARAAAAAVAAGDSEKASAMLVDVFCEKTLATRQVSVLDVGLAAVANSSGSPNAKLVWVPTPNKLSFCGVLRADCLILPGAEILWTYQFHASAGK